jgi:predicted nuclease of predicted toxin-antitoxin system
MKMKLYSDENFPLRTVKELRNLGHDVLTAFDDEKANQAISDEEVLARAIELERAVLTLNRKDFKRLHLKDSNHAGIVICTEDVNRIGQANRISEKIFECKDLNGQLIRVYRPDK